MKKKLLILFLYPVFIFAQDSKDFDFILLAGGKNVQKYDLTTNKWSGPLVDGTFLRFRDIIIAKDKFTLKTTSPWWDFFDWFSKDITLDNTKGKPITLNEDLIKLKTYGSRPNVNVTTNVTILGKNDSTDSIADLWRNAMNVPFNIESELIRIDSAKKMAPIHENDTISLSETDSVALTVVNKDSIPLIIHVLWEDTLWDSLFPRDSVQSYIIEPYSIFNANFGLADPLGKQTILILPSKHCEKYLDKDYFDLIDSLNNGVFTLPSLDNVRCPIHIFTLVP